MKIWDYIKDKLFNRKKALPEPKDEKRNNNQGMSSAINSKKEAFDASLKVDIDIKPNTLDWAIEQYMSSLILQQNLYNKVYPYSALIQLGGMKNLTTGNNEQNQKELLDNIKKGKYGNDVQIKEQRDKNDKNVEFYHICNNGMWSEGKDYRIYLNCKKENVAMLASKLAEELKNQDYYFKFNSNEVNSERSEQFVFYIDDDDDLNNKMMAINKIKQENPKLFEGSNNLNPFLKTVDGYIGYAPEIHKGEYNALDGSSKKVAKSYNSLLSEALEDSFVSSMKSLAKKELNIDISEYIDLNQIASSKLLDTIYDDNNLKAKFIESVKQNLKLASERNPELDIKGIENKTRLQQRTSEDYIPENY